MTTCVTLRRTLRHHRPAFSLMEMLVVMGVLSLMAAMLLPGLSSAREQGRRTVCTTHLRELLRANAYYAGDHAERYAPGAADFLENLHRWHGARDHGGQAFDSRRGPLVPYLDADHLIRQCPTFPADEVSQLGGGFERGAGGYGYNSAYLGALTHRDASREVTVIDDRMGALVSQVRRPSETMMFADSAFAASRMIEYSFIEPRFQPAAPTRRADPSIHFRHRGRANVGWCDGHVDAHERTFTWKSGLYRANPERLNIGWFGASDDNSLFDLW